MTKAENIAQKAAELMKNDAVLVTAADIKGGVVQKIQVYFWSEKSAVMDIITKDDLVQGFPEAEIQPLRKLSAHDPRRGRSAFPVPSRRPAFADMRARHAGRRAGRACSRLRSGGKAFPRQRQG